MPFDGIYISREIPPVPTGGQKRPRKYLYIALAAILFTSIFGALYFFETTTIFVRKPIPLPTEENQNFLNQVTQCFIPIATVYGYDLRITAGFRSITEQTQIYNSGRTLDGHIVSEAPPGHSLHNYGYAVDVADRTAGYNLNWTKLVKIASYCSLESGGVGDLPHFEYRDGLTTDQFLAGMRPPPLTLPCAVMASRSATGTPLTLRDLNACGAPKF
ncbi:MAG: M15 family metallopeptidase [Patescibacteria group bacterium]|nr:M15 family metallopeptidase [Patescibacteria group bacterium]